MLLLTVALDEAVVTRNGVINIYPQGKGKDGRPGFNVQAQFFDVDTKKAIPGAPFILVQANEVDEDITGIHRKMFPSEKCPWDKRPDIKNRVSGLMPEDQGPANQIAFPGAAPAQAPEAIPDPQDNGSEPKVGEPNK